MAGIDENALLVLHGDGDDESTDIIDSSLDPHSPTAVGGAQIDTAQSVFGGASILFGTNRYVNVPDHIDWDLIPDHTVDSCTIDFRMRLTSRPADPGLMGVYQDASNWWGIYWNGTSFFFIGSSVWMVIIDWTPTMNQWYHIAFVHSAPTDNFCFIDGIAQTVTGETNANVSGFSAPLQIGRMARLGRWMQGNLDEIRFSNIARWTENFTPPTEAYSSAPPPPPPPFLPYPDKFIPTVNTPRYKRLPTNPGFSVTPGMEIPVPIKMDKWQNLSQPPVRRKKRNPANTTTVAFVDFSIPTLPVVTIDKWLPNFMVPVRITPRVLPTAYSISFIAALNPINGNYWDSGVVAYNIQLTAEDAQTYADTGEVSFTVSGTAAEVFQLEDHSEVTITIKPPDTGVETFNSGVPGFVSANVIVNGVNKSDYVQGVITVTRENNAAARFRLALEEDTTLPILAKPIEYINKVVEIAFAAADMSGIVADYVPIFKGIIKHVTFNEDMKTLNISGYDYSGVHQTKGEFISENITTVFQGTIGASSAGTLNTGHYPIWGVTYDGSSNVIDGEDYFVSTAEGTIVIPVSSRILQFPGTFTYSYAAPFDTMRDIIQGVVTQKGWTIKEDGVAIVDYTTKAAHPVLSLSDESVIDTCRKFLELSGAKVEGNLFPDLRVYSEVANWITPSNILTLDEDSIFENSLVFKIDFDGLLNEQTVRSVQKVDADIAITGTETLATFSGSQGSINPFSIQGGSNINDIDYQTPAVLVELRINKTNIHSISFSSSGSFRLNYSYNSFYAPITGGSWNYFVDGDDFVIQLKHRVVTAGGAVSGGFYSGYSTVSAYPAVEYALTVNGQKIQYSGGNPEDVRVVTAQRPVSGITETLKGDVYENPYIETDTHCVNICNAVLLEHGNPYIASFEIPLFVAKTTQIGQRVDIKNGGSIIYSGIIKRLGYSINTESGINRVLVRANGIGKGI